MSIFFDPITGGISIDPSGGLTTGTGCACCGSPCCNQGGAVCVVPDGSIVGPNGGPATRITVNSNFSASLLTNQQFTCSCNGAPAGCIPNDRRVAGSFSIGETAIVESCVPNHLFIGSDAVFPSGQLGCFGFGGGGMSTNTVNVQTSTNCFDNSVPKTVMIDGTFQIERDLIRFPDPSLQVSISSTAWVTFSFSLVINAFNGDVLFGTSSLTISVLASNDSGGVPATNFKISGCPHTSNLNVVVTNTGLTVDISPSLDGLCDIPLDSADLFPPITATLESFSSTTNIVIEGITSCLPNIPLSSPCCDAGATCAPVVINGNPPAVPEVQGTIKYNLHHASQAYLGQCGSVRTLMVLNDAASSPFAIIASQSSGECQRYTDKITIAGGPVALLRGTVCSDPSLVNADSRNELTPDIWLGHNGSYGAQLGFVQKETAFTSGGTVFDSGIIGESTSIEVGNAPTVLFGIHALDNQPLPIAGTQVQASFMVTGPGNTGLLCDPAISQCGGISPLAILVDLDPFTGSASGTAIESFPNTGLPSRVFTYSVTTQVVTMGDSFFTPGRCGNSIYRLIATLSLKVFLGATVPPPVPQGLLIHNINLTTELMMTTPIIECASIPPPAPLMGGRSVRSVRTPVRSAFSATALNQVVPVNPQSIFDLGLIRRNNPSGCRNCNKDGGL